MGRGEGIFCFSLTVRRVISGGLCSRKMLYSDYLSFTWAVRSAGGFLWSTPPFCTGSGDGKSAGAYSR